MGYLPKLKTDHLLISVNSSQEALRVLENIKDFKDFELIKGTMDDVVFSSNNAYGGGTMREIGIMTKR